MKLSLALFLLSMAVVGCSSTPKPVAPEAKSPPIAEPTKPATPVPPAKTTPPPKPAIECKRTSEERLIEVLEVEKGCWLMYTSAGIKKRVASSIRGNAHCEKVRDNIRANLESAGFKCQWKE